MERAVDSQVVEWSPRSAGLTHAAAGVASFDDGSHLFVKAATNEHSAAEILNEIALLRAIDAPYMPEVRGMVTEPMPILLLEDLSHWHWPEPYPSNLAPLERALDDLRSRSKPKELDLVRLTGPSIEMINGIVEHAVSATPALAPWLSSCAGAIIEAATRPTSGSALVHSDLWYSNLCFLDDRVVIVDWSHARIGSPWFDASTVGIDLVLEGRRPLPMREAARWAAPHLAWVIWGLAVG
ncbi:MAG: phosphotransferase, partial [Acidimicrobiia bacterium]